MQNNNQDQDKWVVVLGNGFFIPMSLEPWEMKYYNVECYAENQIEAQMIAKDFNYEGIGHFKAL